MKPTPKIKRDLIKKLDGIGFSQKERRKLIETYYSPFSLFHYLGLRHAFEKEVDKMYEEEIEKEEKMFKERAGYLEKYLNIKPE